ncbi:kinetochore Sim4 complex subunit FTA2-domain-containing protein [Xylariomycetidae sp. FL2044]|nr:kinetochore Sim4 complex subunit FTA2-domain-containing protein [Xylariomycetidae sp. FL2044]
MALLPQLPGPKLGPFSLHNDKLDIVFIREIALGGDGSVWKVSIEGKLYALKIFGFSDFGVKPAVHSFLQEQQHLTSEDLKPYRDKFYNECRAYGRLQETGHERLSVKCYGYIILTPKQENDLAEKGGLRTSKTVKVGDELVISAIDNPLERWTEELNDYPLRAIVKELVDLDTHGGYRLNKSMVSKMIRDLDTIHRLGIRVGDIKSDNYLRGVMIDFSRASTVPHPEYSPEFIQYLDKQEFGWGRTAYDDEMGFDWMLDTWNRHCDIGFVKGQRIWIRMLPNRDYREKLRDNSKPNRMPRVRPELFDWKAAERKRERQKALEERLEKGQTSVGNEDAEEQETTATVATTSSTEATTSTGKKAEKKPNKGRRASKSQKLRKDGVKEKKKNKKKST